MGDAARELMLLHSSDLHIGSDDEVRSNLEPVLATARAERVDALLLPGDIFESNRVRHEVLESVRLSLSALGLPVIILPGNHDCLEEGSCYERGQFSGLPNVFVLGDQADEVVLSSLDLHVWGLPHRGHSTMPASPGGRKRRAHWQIAMAHGHFADALDSRYSWPITPADIAATKADYLALGHWDQSRCVSNNPPAWYSGAPHHTGTANKVRLCMDRGVLVELIPVAEA